jgi:hypothetical protein
VQTSSTRISGETEKTQSMAHAMKNCPSGLRFKAQFVFEPVFRETESQIAISHMTLVLNKRLRKKTAGGPCSGFTSRVHVQPCTCFWLQYRSICALRMLLFVRDFLNNLLATPQCRLPSCGIVSSTLPKPVIVFAGPFKKRQITYPFAMYCYIRLKMFPS